MPTRDDMLREADLYRTPSGEAIRKADRALFLSLEGLCPFCEKPRNGEPRCLACEED
jgi:hypothetical protein